MAEKKAKTTKVEKVAETASKSVSELRVDLHKLRLDVKTGKESNTSLIRKLKKEIARKLSAKSN